MSPRPMIDVVLSVLDGADFLEELLVSLRRQTHARWRLHVRDDGSSDGSHRIVERFAAEDPRVRLLERDGRRLGTARGFGWILERLPEDTGYVAFCDADDVWRPDRLERSLDAMEDAEGESPGLPILVHTDLTVVDRDLQVVAPSFWRFQDLSPEPATIGRLLVQNVATGPTFLLNRALLDEVGTIPAEAVHQDWWIALVAAATGRIVALPVATVLYRQHDSNAAGAHPLGDRSVATTLRRIVASPGRTGAFRDGLEATARQAGAFLERHGDRLDDEERRRVDAYAGIPECGPVVRRLRVARLRTLPEHGLLRNLAAVLRA